LELYCELLLARFGLLEQKFVTISKTVMYANPPLTRLSVALISTKEPDPGIVEGVCCIIHAAPRTELKGATPLSLISNIQPSHTLLSPLRNLCCHAKSLDPPTELHLLRDMLMHKYGREFSAAVMENRDGCVSERVVKKLAIGTPPPDLVDAYLGEIAKGYGVEWAPPPVQKDDSEDDDASGGLKESVPRLEPPLKALDPVSAEKLSPTTPALPDLPPTVDADADRTNRTNAASKGAGRVSPPATKPEDEDPFTALSRRFDALKKK